MHAKPKIWRSKELADTNAKIAQRISAKFESAKKEAEQADADLQRSLEHHFDAYLAPFAMNFSRIKNVDLESPDLLDRVPEANGHAPDTVKAELGAVKGLVSIAGGAAAGAGAGALTFTAVGALATASTGTAIGSLSGAAATSATLAWLGGGSLAAGGLGVAGGTVILASVVALPVVLATGGFLSYQGRKELAKQESVALELEQADAEARAAHQKVRLLGARVQDTEFTLKKVAARMGPLNMWLAELLESKDDYRHFTPSERDRLALLVSLAIAMTAVMREPLLKSDEISPHHEFAMRETRHFLTDPGGEGNSLPGNLGA